jgi:hypothetical protein
MERMSQTVARAASLVTEAATWGFDISTWRAHLNEITWPEVLRQLAIAAGWGPRRCRPARATRAYDERRLGEDIVEGKASAALLHQLSRGAIGAYCFLSPLCKPILQPIFHHKPVLMV